MDIEFDNMAKYLQDYIDNKLQDDFDKITPAQRIGFVEKYIEFIAPKQLRRGTSKPTGSNTFGFDELLPNSFTSRPSKLNNEQED